MNHVHAVAERHLRVLEAFAEVARRCCACIEEWWAVPDRYDICTLLADLERLLPEVYSAATTLPPTDDWFYDDDDEDEEVAETRLPEFFAEVRRSTPSVGPADANGLAIHLIRAWLAAWVEVEELTPALVFRDVGQPARVDLVPSSVVQFLWLTFAVTVGAIDMGIAVPGVHQCDYCQALFLGDRSRVRGDHVFCSESHGKRFHARKRMREKRAAERERQAAATAASQPQVSERMRQRGTSRSQTRTGTGED